MAATGKRATIHDVARLAGVSIKTVSRVYNDEPNVREAIREKVKQAGAQLRYRPNVAARNLVERRSHLIGLFFENPSSSYVTELQMGALERLRGTRYRLLIFPVENRADIRGALIETAHASGLDGIIVTPPMSDDPDILQELTASALPFAREAGIEGNSDYEVQGGFSFASGLVAGRKLLSLPNRPTAIFASNDDMAAAVMQVAYDAGIAVPDDLTVVGFDDSAIATMVSPQITTVRQPIFEMTRDAADMLLRQMESGETSPAQRIDYKLIVRQSSARVPA
ncbi:LacI family DNA-binding transcriptional regulator [Brucella melitensis]